MRRAARWTVAVRALVALAGCAPVAAAGCDAGDGEAGGAASADAAAGDVGSSAGDLPEAGAPAPAALMWVDTGFAAAMPVAVSHVTEILLGDGGATVHVGFVDPDGDGRVARSLDGGATWAVAAPDRLAQPRRLRRFPGGDLVLGGSAHAGGAPLRFSRDGGATWEACGGGPDSAPLPSAEAEAVWDLLLLDDGTLVVATDSLANDPALPHRTVLASTDGCRTLAPLAPLPGLGVLALAVDGGGALYAATEESAEHDDPALAGQARVFRSTDRGASWVETGRLEGANRVYGLLVERDGVTILAGSGLGGDVFRSTDRGDTWERRTHVPAGTKPWGDPPVPTSFDATRVYSLLELQDGRVLVGSGNATGDLFVTADDGVTWQATGDTGPSIVCWALAQATDGTVWVGTGSRGGGLFTATP